MYMSSLLLKRGDKMRTPSLSCLRCFDLSGVEAVVRGGARMGIGGGRGMRMAGCIPPSGIAIILQTECHALQTADKKTVTTVGW